MNKLMIIPQPKEIKRTGKARLSIKEGDRILINPDLFKEAKFLKEKIKKLKNIDLPIQKIDSKSLFLKVGKKNRNTQFHKINKLGKEGYRLIIDKEGIFRVIVETGYFMEFRHFFS